jgi:hypothetical protein
MKKLLLLLLLASCYAQCCRRRLDNLPSGWRRTGNIHQQLKQKMFRLLIVLALSLPVSAQGILAGPATVAAASVTPTLVQAVDDSDWSFDLGTNSASGTTVNIYLPRLTGAGNTLAVGLSMDDNTGSVSLPTIADGSSDTFSTGVRCNDSGNGESLVMYSAVNIAGGTNKLTITYHAVNAFGAFPVVSEWARVATSSVVDHTSCNTNATTTITAAASGTLAHSGDAVIQYAWNDSLAYTNTTSNPGNGVHYTKGASGCTWALLNNSSDWGFGSQYCVYSSTSTLTPSFTVSTAVAVSGAMYLVPCTTCGTLVPAGQQILYRKDQPTVTFSTTPTFYFAGPSASNTIVANWPAGPHDMTALSDSNSNSYSSTTASHCDGGGPITCVHNHYAGSATVSEAMSLSPTFASTPGNDYVFIYALKGMSSSPFDTEVSGTGDQTSAANLTYLSITPGVSAGIMLFDASLDFNTHSTFTSPGALTETCNQSNEPLSAGGCAANNPFGNFIFSSASSQTWTGSFIGGSTAVGWWTAEADSYK